LLQLFQKDDAPLRLAIGFALGCCCNFYPTFGFGLPLAMAIAYLTRTSIIGSVVGENLVKPIYPLLLYFNIIVGGLLYPLPNRSLTLDFFLANFTKWGFYVPYAKAFFAGAIINTVVIGGLVALIAYLLLLKYRDNIIKFLLKKEGEPA
jgi:uncharacterized protein (DUF2062 family)